jgi:hypothetical protein
MLCAWRRQVEIALRLRARLEFARALGGTLGARLAVCRAVLSSTAFAATSASAATPPSTTTATLAAISALATISALASLRSPALCSLRLRSCFGLRRCGLLLLLLLLLCVLGAMLGVTASAVL